MFGYHFKHSLSCLLKHLTRDVKAFLFDIQTWKSGLEKLGFKTPTSRCLDIACNTDRVLEKLSPVDTEEVRKTFMVYRISKCSRFPFSFRGLEVNVVKVTCWGAGDSQFMINIC